MKFYKKLPDMECIVGDTLPEFNIFVDGETSLSGCTMQLILADSKAPETAVICKECTAISGGFKVILTSEDTSNLTGGTVYFMHFRLIKNGQSYRKLFGCLTAKTVPEGE
jgi:hypothetical protein